jgi:hypothetical protein
MTTYITPANTAKMLRTKLKDAHPSVKCSVHTSSYANGASITVAVPNNGEHVLDQIRAIAQTFANTRFNNETLNYDTTTAIVDGEEYFFCVDYVFVEKGW